MTRWKERGISKSIKYFRTLFKNRLFVVSLVIIVTGLGMYTLSTFMSYTYDSHMVQKYTVNLDNGNVANVTFFTVPHYPAKIAFTYETNVSTLQYSIYKMITIHTSILLYNYSSTLVTKGQLHSDGTIILNATSDVSYYSTDETYGQKYYMHVTSIPQNKSVVVKLNVETTIPEHRSGNPFVGDSAGIITVTGLASLSLYVTNEVRKKEK